MTLKEQITSDLKDSLKSGDAFKRSVLGMLKSSIGNKEIEKRKKDTGLSEEENIEVIRSEVKKRIDSALAFRSVGDEERAKIEESEMLILKKYLPPEASDEDIKSAVERAIVSAGSKSKKDFGKIMGLSMKEIGSRADGNRVKQILDSMLEN
jgi:uncharacterized protein YqeY